MDAWIADRRPVRRISYRGIDSDVRSEADGVSGVDGASEVDGASQIDLGGWPFTLPPVAQLLRDGLELAPGVTFLVGENGSGKSTLIEGVAMAYGLGAEGGSRGVLHATRATESPLHQVITLQRSAGAGSWGYFLRAETAHGLFSYLEDNPGRPASDLHRMSHGESFLEVLATRFNSPGFYCLDEPESALSFSSVLTLLATLHHLAGTGAQVLCATHSPLLTALPGATILEVGEHGYRQVAWEELELVAHWRGYLDSPQRYLRHLLGP